jgi:hypothetical protein
MALVARKFSALGEIVAFGGQIVHVDRHPIEDGAQSETQMGRSNRVESCLRTPVEQSVSQIN